MTSPSSTKQKSHIALKIASFSCIIHCILTPFILLMAPALGSLFENHLIELGLLIFSILCGSYIVYSGFCQHKRRHSLFLYSAGVCLWLIHSMLEDNHDGHISFYLLGGTALILVAYFINHYYIKKCPASCCSGHESN